MEVSASSKLDRHRMQPFLGSMQIRMVQKNSQDPDKKKNENLFIITGFEVNPQLAGRRQDQASNTAPLLIRNLVGICNPRTTAYNCTKFFLSEF